MTDNKEYLFISFINFLYHSIQFSVTGVLYIFNYLQNPMNKPEVKALKKFKER